MRQEHPNGAFFGNVSQQIRLLVLLMIALDFQSVVGQNVTSSMPLFPSHRIDSWACVYSRMSVAELSSSPAALLVIDPDFYSAEEIKSVKQSRKIVLAYISIGEAENYRSYFPKIKGKSYLGSENPSWKGNFMVEYSHPEWKRILCEYSQKIIEKGFDGLLFDVVDSWENHGTNSQTRSSMTGLIVSLAEFLRAKNPALILLLQNSDRLFENPKVMQLFNGLTQESLFYSWRAEHLSWHQQRDKIARLRNLRQQGKFIGLLEYTRIKSNITKCKTEAFSYGFIPYFSEKELDRLFPIP